MLGPGRTLKEVLPHEKWLQRKADAKQYFVLGLCPFDFMTERSKSYQVSNLKNKVIKLFYGRKILPMVNPLIS